MKRTPLTRSQPLRKKSAAKRSTKSPRCTVRGCKQIARIDTYCRSHAQREADRLFSLVVRADGICYASDNVTLSPIGLYRVGCSGGLQCAHVHSRRYHVIRWDLANAVPLCAAHHVYFTHRPLEWRRWCEAFGIDYGGLYTLALDGTPPDLADVLRDLRLKVAA